MVEKNLDLLGEVCPTPLLKMEEAVKGLNGGQKVVIEVDHTQAVRNIMDWCEERNHEFVVNEISPGVWKIEITKNQEN